MAKSNARSSSRIASSTRISRSISVQGRSTGKAGGKDWLPLRARLVAAGDPELAVKYARIAPGCGSVLGITVPVLREMARVIATSGDLLTPSRVADMADVAFASRCREEMLLVTFLLARFKKALTPELWPRLDRWIDGLDNWEACDQLAMGIGGEMIARAEEGEQRARCLKDLNKWAGASNPWRRRFAVAATTVLNQKGRSDAVPALRICERLIADRDKSVQSAVAWALREACKSDANAVFDLLKKHRATMPRTTLRQSAEKLTIAQRMTLGVAGKREGHELSGEADKG